jgi:pyrroline-5-carboxylate reductase
VSQDRIAFIGAGNMATSLIGGLLATGRAPGSITAADPDPEQLVRISELGVASTHDNAEAVADAAVVVLAVKPQVLGKVVADLAGKLNTGQLLLSIAAGVPADAISRWAQAPLGVVRCMPNTPALFGAGMTAMFANVSVTPQQRVHAARIAEAVGEVVWVDTEAEIDAVTAVSGSGPAYFFYLMEQMIAAGIELGLAPETARTLTLQTARGAAVMAIESDDAPAQLRLNVTSPGGTTEAALGVFESAGLAATIHSALAGAARRSQELAVEYGSSPPVATATRTNIE